MKVLAYIRDQDWDLARTRFQPTPMRPDGRLEVRLPACPGDRLVIPTVFLGRRDDGRLGFLCDLLDLAQGVGWDGRWLGGVVVLVDCNCTAAHHWW